MTESGGPRRVIERHNRDAEITAAGISIFFQKGYPAATIQDVADRVGVLKGSLYHYISSKENLLMRILQGSHDQGMDIIAAAAAMDVPPDERLWTYLNRLMLWYTDNLERCSLYFNEWRYLTGDNARLVREQRREVERFVRGTLEEAYVAGLVRDGTDLKLASFHILGSVNSLPVWYRSSGPYEPAEIAAQFALMSCRAVFTKLSPGLLAVARQKGEKTAAPG